MSPLHAHHKDQYHFHMYSSQKQLRAFGVRVGEPKAVSGLGTYTYNRPAPQILASRIEPSLLALHLHQLPCPPHDCETIIQNYFMCVRSFFWGDFVYGISFLCLLYTP
jgi:hypothetical protein